MNKDKTNYYILLSFILFILMGIGGVWWTATNEEVDSKEDLELIVGTGERG